MKTKKRLSTLVAALLTLSMLIAGAMPVFATAAEGDGEGATATANTFSVWDGTLSETLSGTGTETDPILIKSASDLALLAKKTNEGAYKDAYTYVKLDADIDLNNIPWAPIGMWGGGYLWGEFDGQGHTIKGLFINETSPSFFPSADKEYAITDKAALFGWAQGSIEQPTVIKNFDLDGEVTTQKQRTENGVVITEKGGINKAGGVAGTAVNVTFEDINCSVDLMPSYTSTITYDDSGKIKGVSGTCYAGGIAGEGRGHFSVNNCTYTGSIYINFDKKNDVIIKETDNLATAINQFYVGGIVGTAAVSTYAGTNRTIKDCTVTGSISVTCHSNNSNTRVGGIAGAMMNGCLIENTHMLGAYTFKQTSGGKGACRTGYFVGGFGYSQNGAGLAKSSIIASSCVIPATVNSNINSGATNDGAVGNSSNTDKLEIAIFTVQDAANDITFRAVQRDTTAITDTFDARLVSTLDSVNYSAVGYTVSVACGAENGTMALMPLTSVFTAVKHGNETLTANQLSNNEDAYIAALEITDIPAVGTASIVVTPYVVGVDETTVIYGATTVLTFVDGVHFNTTTLQY